MKHHRILSIIFLSIWIMTFIGCTNTPQSSKNNSEEQKAQDQTLFAITNVNIIPMTIENNIVKNATVVLIRNKKGIIIQFDNLYLSGNIDYKIDGVSS